MARILITGSSGFAGAPVVRRVVFAGHEVVGSGRGLPPPRLEFSDWHIVPTLSAGTDWTAALHGVDTVIHLAGVAHAPRQSAEARRLIHSVNAEGTENLAAQSVAAGVRRFIYISSIKVFGEDSNTRPFTSNDKTSPEDAYGASKLEAELRLRRLSATSRLQVVIIRAPLMIGPGPKGNLARIVRLVRTGVPLPFSSTHNVRSLLSVDNLSDLILTCIDHPAATSTPLLATDDDAPSTPELIYWIAQAAGTKARLFPFPPSLIEAMAAPFGMRPLICRLTRSLAMDSSETNRLTGWRPGKSTIQSLTEALS